MSNKVIRGSNCENRILFEKRILLFAPAFFGYENIIAEKMSRMGAKVSSYDVRSVTNTLDRAALKISPALFKWKTRKYYSDILRKERETAYDFILFIKCDMPDLSILKEFRNTYPNAKFCLYLWDSFVNNPGITSKLSFFDYISSFDRQDCLSVPKMHFRPLFFHDEFKSSALQINKMKYDISFCGTIHSDRYRIIRQVENICKDKQWNFYEFLYIQSHFVYDYFMLTKSEFRGTGRDKFSFKKKNSNEIASIVADSSVVLDIQHPRQTGLTMRTIEMIGMQKKVITTNEDIRNYDFFDERNICVINRNNVEIPAAFICNPYAPINNDVYNKYRLESWIVDVLGIGIEEKTNA